MWVFNAEVTTYPRIAPLLDSHDCLIALVLSLWTLWETALGGVLFSPSMILVCRGQYRIVLGNVPWQFGPSLFVLGHIFLLSMGLGLDMKLIGVVKSFGPTITIY